jgi:hypothetical protein
MLKSIQFNSRWRKVRITTMRHTLQGTFFITALALLMGSCQLLPANLRSRERQSGSVLFQDEFSDLASGWDRLPQDPAVILDYSAGGYRMQVNSPHTMIWAGPGLTFADLWVEVEAIQIAGPEDGDYGLVCRAVDQRNFYFLAVSGDGYYGIGKVKDGVPELLGMPAMPPSEAIRRGKDSNHLRAGCIGENLSLYVNGELLATVQDQDFNLGESGLLVGTFESPGTEVFFDKFSVLQP